mgnify:CR=1 FL=1
MNRRSFMAAAAAVLAPRGNAQQYSATAGNVLELSFRSAKPYADPFNELELEVTFTSESGARHSVPAYWAGEQNWRVRYAPPSPGRYNFLTHCSDASNQQLHGQEGTLEVAPYGGSHPLYLHGALRVSSNRRYLEHADGTPFFWLGDTWWMGLTKRLRWPEDFQYLASDRAQKGFTVIQIVAGLFPDMDSFDPRGTNEAGFAWQPGYSRINPAFFDMADLRIQHLIDRGLTPCILGCWGYYLPKIGIRKMKQHWRYLIARWGAFPVVWCLAGEGTMPYYLSSRPDQDRSEQRTGWTEIARYVRAADPFRRPITIHPSRTARESVDDPAVLDFNMLQTGHSGRKSYANTIRTLTNEYAAEPRMPVVNGEVCYEGIFEASREEVQRFLFWSNMLSGAAGFTYGANGIWQVNTEQEPFGPSPHGRTWGNVPWNQAAAYPGSRQLGLGASLLRRYQWWRFEPHPEWVEPHWTPQNYEQPYAAGIPRQLKFIYLPGGWDPPKAIQLEDGLNYRAFLWEPSTGRRIDLGAPRPLNGAWRMETLPATRDWVVVLENPSLPAYA